MSSESPQPNNSFGPTSPDLSPSLPGARDYHRRQAALLTSALQRAAPARLDLPDLLDPQGHQENEDPREKLARLEKEGQRVLREIEETKVNVERMEILALLAHLDLKDLKVLKQLLTMNGWQSLLRNKCGLK